MHTDTVLKLRELRADGLSIEQRIERAKASSAQRDLDDGRVVTHPMLPNEADPSRPKPCMVLDADDLMNMTYHAVSNVLRHTSMTKTTAQAYATRAAEEAVTIARADGWLVE